MRLLKLSIDNILTSMNLNSILWYVNTKLDKFFKVHLLIKVSLIINLLNKIWLMPLVTLLGASASTFMSQEAQFLMKLGSAIKATMLASPNKVHVFELNLACFHLVHRFVFSGR